MTEPEREPDVWMEFNVIMRDSDVNSMDIWLREGMPVKALVEVLRDVADSFERGDMIQIR